MGPLINPTASVFDLVQVWEPHPDQPEIRLFNAKEGLGVKGFAWEDGFTFHLAEMYAERPHGFGRIALFLNRAMDLYSEIRVELPRDSHVALALLDQGFVFCSMQKLDKSQVSPMHRPWCFGVVWRKGYPRLNIKRYLDPKVPSSEVRAWMRSMGWHIVGKMRGRDLDLPEHGTKAPVIFPRSGPTSGRSLG